MSETEAPLVVTTPGGLSVSYGGRLLYSGRDPERLARRVALSCDAGPGRLHLVPSPLLWHGVRELLASIGEGSALVCVEAEPELAALAAERIPPDLAAELSRPDGERRIAFVDLSLSRALGPGAAPHAALEAVLAAVRGLGDFRFCRVDSLSGGQALHGRLYSELAEAIGSELEAAWRNRAALMVLGRRWARNVFDNIAALPEIAAAAAPRFPGAAIVCGAGSSLEAALPFIAAERGHLSVIACDTALGSLLAAGLEPDLVVCLEAQAHNLPDFTCLGSRPVSLLADLSSHPATFRAVAGPKALSLVRITPSPFLDRVRSALSGAGLPFMDLPPLGSVGVEAYCVARELAEGPVLAAGLDFSYPAGKSHARGCPSLLAEERRLSRLTRWPSQYAASFRDRTLRLGADVAGLDPSLGAGREAAILSDPILLSYAALLEERARSDSSPGEPALYDLRAFGPGIGGLRITFEAAHRLLGEAGTGAGDAAPSAARPAASAPTGAEARKAAAQAARAILREEIGRLDALRQAMHGARAASAGEFARLALESDYLWWSFPDQGRVRARASGASPSGLPQDFMNRLVPEAEWWSMRLEALEGSLE